MSTKRSLVVAATVALAGLLVGLTLRHGSLAASLEPDGRALVRPAAGPIVSGKLVSVQAWKYPLDTKSGNEASTYTEGRVDVYDRFIVVNHPHGERTLHLHGYYTNLRFKGE